MNTITCPIPKIENERILLAHGGGGRMTGKLIHDIFYPAFSNPLLEQQHDGAVFNAGNKRLAYTTDSFVVDPIFFPGGDIGDLAINGTVNDLACCGAVPLYLTAAFIIEEGFAISDLKKIVSSMKRAADKAGVSIVTGDTKVVDRGKCDRIFINTSGVGIVPEGININPTRTKEGDAVIISGRIAEHGISILTCREGLSFESSIKSDTASLNGMLRNLLEEVPSVHVLRDPTRGGVASTLNEIAESANVTIELEEASLPVSPQVEVACELLGFDPLYVANEGVVLVIVPEEYAQKTTELLRNHPEGRNACRIGSVVSEGKAQVRLRTIVQSSRIVDMISGEQLPRIC